MNRERVIRTACRGCHGVCQVLVHMDDAGRVVRVSGDPESPTSRGYICPKGQAAPEQLYHPDRILRPMRRTGPRGSGQWKAISWDEALAEMAEVFDRVRRESGPEFVALGQGTGRPYTEFTGRFIHAFGSPNFIQLRPQLLSAPQYCRGDHAGLVSAAGYVRPRRKDAGMHPGDGREYARRRAQPMAIAAP